MAYQDKIVEMVKAKVMTEPLPEGSIQRKRKHADTDEDDPETVKRKAIQRENSKKAAIRQKQKNALSLQRRARERLLGNKASNEYGPRNVIGEKIKEHHDDEKFKKDLQEGLSKELPTTEQIAKLADASQLGPHYFGRTTSLVYGSKWKLRGKRATNGFTTENLIMPAADTNDGEGLHIDITVMPSGRVVYTIGHHLIWTDAPWDEFMSYSIDATFLIILALWRYGEGQKRVSIQYLDRRRAHNLKGEKAAFYPALELGQIFELWNWKGWTSP